MEPLRMILLFDVYGETLTEKQRNIFDLRYNQDFSLGEIAELMQISRQAVRDTIMRTQETLSELEEKIGMVSMLERQAAAAAEVRKAEEAENLAAAKAHAQAALMLLKEDPNGV